MFSCQCFSLPWRAEERNTGKGAARELYLQHSNVPSEALDGLVELPSFQAFLGPQIMKFFVELHPFGKNTHEEYEENVCIYNENIANKL